LEFGFQSFLIAHYPHRKKVVDRKNKKKTLASISLTSSAVEPSLTAQLTISLLFKNHIKRLQKQRART
jgi:hypothetical protein